MHSFHQSRGRILFEFLCALGIVASCVGAWKQTGASTLLAAAFVAGLYGFVHLFDLARRDPADVEEPQRIDFEVEAEDDRADHQTAVVPFAVDEPTSEGKIEEAEIVELPALRAKAPRKGSRRAKTPKEAKVTELAPPVEDDAPGFASQKELEADEFPPPEETAHPHIAPLFEPEPFARMSRRAFGRRGRI